MGNRHDNTSTVLLLPLVLAVLRTTGGCMTTSTVVTRSETRRVGRSSSGAVAVSILLHRQTHNNDSSRAIFSTY